MSIQNYEKYWKLTLEYTDFNDKKFLKTLEIIVNKIDYLNRNNDYKYTSKDYQDLQDEILLKIPKNASQRSFQLASTRKAINQCVKLGFINPKLSSYHTNTKDYLLAKTNRKRNTLLSKIIYSNSKFNSSTKNEHQWSQINFLLKTLEEVGKLHKNEIIALMLVDITKYRHGYITKNEIIKYTDIAMKNGFIKRKKNQISYLRNLLNKLDDVIFFKDELYFEEDAKVIFGDDLKLETKKRDGYLHRIYKNQLQEEVEDKFKVTKCMLEKLSYPSLVASHIKPFIQCLNDDEAYDPNNGLLLSRNMDILFDQGYISFNDDGTIIYSPQLNEDVTKHLDNYKLDKIFINQIRIQYFDYHRNNVFRKSA